MLRKLALAATILIVSTPFFSSALTADEVKQQIATLLSQVTVLQQRIAAQSNIGAQTTLQNQNTSSGASSCPQVTRTLSVGMRGSDVLSLQQYLVSQGVLSADSATGYYGPLTQSAVQNWQASHGVVTSGTPATTGYGLVGARTRALIALNCSTGLSSQTPMASTQQRPSACAAVAIAAICATGSTSQPSGYDSNGCALPYKCVPAVVGAPAISSVDGPASLNVGQQGVWTVRASVPNQPGANIRYSVLWGDEGPISSSQSAASPLSNLTTSSTFTHTYSNLGTYSPRFTVSNDAGSAQVSSTVKVGVSGPPISCAINLTSVRAACPAGQHYEPGPTTYDSNGCPQTYGAKCVPNTITFTATPTSGPAPLQVLFAASNGGGNILNPGDGSSSVLMGPSAVLCTDNLGSTSSCESRGVNTYHTYRTPGTYTAYLLGGPDTCNDSPGGPSKQCLGPTVTITVAGQTSQPVSSVQSITSTEQFVRHLYSCGLGREGEAAGVSQRVSRLQERSVSIQNMYKEILAGAEYQNRNRDNTQFVNDLYNCVLFRAGEASGVADRVQRLNSESRAGMLDEIMAGQEFTQNVLPVLNARISQAVSANSNLANALGALESALKGILSKLGR